MFGDFARHSATAAPLYGELSDGVADDPELAALLLTAPVVQRQPVLLFACVHWLVLAHPDEPLAAFYPNVAARLGVERPPGPAIEAFRAFCGDHAADLRRLLSTRRTQTNEIGRTALFLPVFALVERDAGPFAHVDVGASAGLNLLHPFYDFSYEPGGEIGSGSTVRITCGTRGQPPIPSTRPTVVSGTGLDATPIDVRDPDQARWLEACVWPDQVERFERLAAAVAIAVREGVDVRRGDAVTDVGALVAEAAAVGHPVVTTSWVLNYLTSAQRLAFVAALDAAGAERDLSWVYAENPTLCPELPGGPVRPPSASDPTALVLVRWRGGRREAVHVADTHPHGRWLHWLGTPT
jgi:hypothetical protein